MKRVVLFIFLALTFWTCSTELDLLDNWKETMIVYGLLDQNQPKQYIRIQKAFLGPDSALAMAQEFDSINYMHQLSVLLQEYDQNGNLVSTYTLTPDTFYNKDSGTFAYPKQVIYSMNTPGSMPTNHNYKINITNAQTGNNAYASTSLIPNYNINQPGGPTINFIKFNSATMFTVDWQGVSQARIYQVGLKFHYTETDINNVTVNKVTPEWTMGSIETTSSNASSTQTLMVDPNAFYHFLTTCIFDDPNVLQRNDDYVELTVYAGGEELDTYMNLNGPSTSLVQEKPFYTNIVNGYGVFSARVAKTRSPLTLTPLTQDTLSRGHITCSLRFADRNGQVLGCQ